MNDVLRQDVVTARREPKTQRGRATRDEILGAARILLSEKWLDELPFTELAASAGVARASLLHAFPHWRNVLWDFLEQEVELMAKSCLAATALKRVRPSDRTYAMLAPLLDRAEISGRFYSNLRGAMFSWNGEASDEDFSQTSPDLPLRREVIGAFTRIVLNDIYISVEKLLEVPQKGSLKPNEVRPVPVGECLVNFAFDLAAGSPTHFVTFENRRHALRSVIDLVAAGIHKSKPPSARKPRA